jgi:hypothetical protein
MIIPNRLVKDFESRHEDTPSITCYKLMSSYTYVVLLICNGAMATSVVVKDYRHEYLTDAVNYAAFLISSLAAGVPSNCIISKIGFRNACIASAVLLLVGTSLRMLSVVNAWFIIAGQIIIGISCPLSQNGIYKYCRQSFTRKIVNSQ